MKNVVFLGSSFIHSTKAESVVCPGHTSRPWHDSGKHNPGPCFLRKIQTRSKYIHNKITEDDKHNAENSMRWLLRTGAFKKPPLRR